MYFFNFYVIVKSHIPLTIITKYWQYSSCWTIHPCRLPYIQQLYLSVSHPYLPHSPSWITSFFSVSMSLFLFCCPHQSVVFFRFHICLKSYGICFFLIFSPQHNVLQVHPCCCKCQHFVLFMTEQYSIVYIYSTSSLPIHQLIDTQVASMPWPL